MTHVLAGGPLPPAADAARRPRRGAFAVTAAGALLVSLDVSVANALMPAIGADFRGDGRAAVSWVITAYAIVFAATLVPAGRVADRAGRRRTYLGGLAVFALGSVVCGVAPDLGVLLAGRVVQGVGAAAASPASLGLLLAATDSRDRATYTARWTGAAALGMTLGPFVGGALTSLGDWRWAFWVNVPIVAATALAAPRVLPETPRIPGRRLPDPAGAVLLMLGAARTHAPSAACRRVWSSPCSSYAGRPGSPCRCWTSGCCGDDGWRSPPRRASSTRPGCSRCSCRSWCSSSSAGTSTSCGPGPRSCRWASSSCS
jgi:MFS family permease